MLYALATFYILHPMTGIIAGLGMGMGMVHIALSSDSSRVSRFVPVRLIRAARSRMGGCLLPYRPQGEQSGNSPTLLV